MLKYHAGEPEEGTPTLGVVYHIVREGKIIEALERCGVDAKPVGYVIEVEDEENDD